MCRHTHKPKIEVEAELTSCESCMHPVAQSEKKKHRTDNSVDHERRFPNVALLCVSHQHVTQDVYALSGVVTMGVVGGRICELAGLGWVTSRVVDCACCANQCDTHGVPNENYMGGHTDLLHGRFCDLRKNAGQVERREAGVTSTDAERNCCLKWHVTGQQSGQAQLRYQNPW